MSASIVITYWPRAAANPALNAAVVRVLLQAGQGQQIGDDRIQAVGLAIDDLQEALQVGLVPRRFGQDGLDEALDGGDGGLQLVADVGQEL